MAFKVQVSPAQTAIHQGQTVMVTKPDGQVDWPSTRGLYFRDTSDRSTAGASDPSLEVSNGECHDSFALSSASRPGQVGHVANDALRCGCDLIAVTMRGDCRRRLCWNGGRKSAARQSSSRDGDRPQ